MWSEVQAELALAVGEPTYRIWLAALNARELRSGRLVVEAPQHARRWIAVRFSTGEAFTNEFLDALTCGRTDVFKARFRHVDVLLLDDIHFIERKAKTEEEFFHTFNTLTDSGRQIVITSDRPPDDLQSLEDRLRERFKAGLVAEMGAPDLGTRVAILRKRVQHDRIELDDENALHVIAERIDTNVRALEGAL